MTKIEQARDEAKQSKSVDQINKLENVVRKLASCKPRQPSIIESSTQKLQIDSNCAEMFIVNDQTQMDTDALTTGSKVSQETQDENKQTKDASLSQRHNVRNVVQNCTIGANKQEEVTAMLTISESQNMRNVRDKRTDLEVIGTAMKLFSENPLGCENVYKSKKTLKSSGVEKSEKMFHGEMRQNERENPEEITDIDTQSEENVLRKLASSKLRRPKITDSTQKLQNDLNYFEICVTEDQFQKDTVLTIGSEVGHEIFDPSKHIKGTGNPASFENQNFGNAKDKGSSLEVVGTAMKIFTAVPGAHENDDKSTRTLRSSVFDKSQILNEGVRSNEREKPEETVGVESRRYEEAKEMMVVDLRKGERDQSQRISKVELTERNKTKERVGSDSDRSDGDKRKENMDTCISKRTDISTNRNDRNKKQIIPMNNDLTRSVRYKPEVRNDLTRSTREKPGTRENDVTKSVRQKPRHEMHIDDSETFEEVSVCIRVTRQTKTGENLGNAFEMDSSRYNTEISEEKYASSGMISDLKNRCKTDSPNFEKALKRYLLEDAAGHDENVSNSPINTVKKLKTATDVQHNPVKQLFAAEKHVSADATRSDSGRNLFEAMGQDATLTQHREQNESMLASPRTLRSLLRRVKPETNCTFQKSETTKEETSTNNQNVPCSAVASTDIKKSLSIIGQRMKIHRAVDESLDKEPEVFKRTLRSSNAKEEIVNKDKTGITQKAMKGKPPFLSNPQSHMFATPRRFSVVEGNTDSFETEGIKVIDEKKDIVECKSQDDEVTDFKRTLRSSSFRNSITSYRKQKEKSNLIELECLTSRKSDKEITDNKRSLRSSSLKDSVVPKISKLAADQKGPTGHFDKEAKVFIKKLRSSSVGDRIGNAESNKAMRRISGIVNKHLGKSITDKESNAIKRTLRSSCFKDEKMESPITIEKNGVSNQGDTAVRSLRRNRLGRMLRSQSCETSSAKTTETKKNIIDISHETKGIRKDCSVKLSNTDVVQKSQWNFPKDMLNIEAVKVDKQVVDSKAVCKKKMDKAKNFNNSSTLRNDFDEEMESKPRYKRAKTLQVCRHKNKKRLELWDRRLEIIGHHIQSRVFHRTIRGIEFPVNVFVWAESCFTGLC